MNKEKNPFPILKLDLKMDAVLIPDPINSQRRDSRLSQVHFIFPKVRKDKNSFHFSLDDALGGF